MKKSHQEAIEKISIDITKLLLKNPGRLAQANVLQYFLLVLLTCVMTHQLVFVIFMWVSQLCQQAKLVFQVHSYISQTFII